MGNSYRKRVRLPPARFRTSADETSRTSIKTKHEKQLKEILIKVKKIEERVGIHIAQKVYVPQGPLHLQLMMT